MTDHFNLIMGTYTFKSRFYTVMADQIYYSSKSSRNINSLFVSFADLIKPEVFSIKVHNINIKSAL